VYCIGGPHLFCALWKFSCTLGWIYFPPVSMIRAAPFLPSPIDTGRRYVFRVFIWEYTLIDKCYLKLWKLMITWGSIIKLVGSKVVYLVQEFICLLTVKVLEIVKSSSALLNLFCFKSLSQSSIFKNFSKDEFKNCLFLHCFNIQELETSILRKGKYSYKVKRK